MVRSLLDAREKQLGLKMSTHMLSWTQCEVYTKALLQKTHARAQVSSGQVLNLMQTDSWHIWQVQQPRPPSATQPRAGARPRCAARRRLRLACCCCSRPCCC